MASMLNKLIHRPIAVTMIVAALAILGIIAVLRMPVSLMPDVDVPHITVSATMPGYSAKQVEQDIITPLRMQLQRTAGIKEVESVASNEGGTIKLTFEPGTDVGPLFIDVNEKVDMAMASLPHSMERPRVIKGNANDLPAFFVDIYPKNSQDTTSTFSQMSDLVRNVLSRRLEQLSAVAMTDVSGLASTEVVCIPHTQQLAALGITINDVSQAIAGRNVMLEALTVHNGEYQYSLHFDSGNLTVNDLKNIHLNLGRRVIRLGEICDIHEREAARHAILRHNGRECVSVAVIKQADARMNTLRQQVDTTIASLRSQYPQLAFDVTRDQTQLLSYSIDNMKWNLIAAAVFTILVLLCFLRRWQLALLVSISIPLSIIITLIGFATLGMSINVISLSGLILGVGMIVDNSIIVVDNTLQKRRAKQSVKQAICHGAAEVFTPMLASVLTTCSVFLPLILVGGMAGALFFDQAMAVTFALLASLAVAMIVLPVWLYAMAKNKKEIAVNNQIRFLSPLFRWHSTTQKWMLRHATACLLVATLCIPGTAIIYNAMSKKQLPGISHTDTIMHIDWNSSITAIESDRRTSSILNALATSSTTWTSMCGPQQFLLSHTPEITESDALAYINCTSRAALDSMQVQLVQFINHRWPQATVSFEPAGNLFDIMFRTSEPNIQLQLQTANGQRPTVNQAMCFVSALQRHFPSLSIPHVATEDEIVLNVNPQMLSLYSISYEQLVG